MYTIGAISLHRTINSLQYPSNRRLQRKSTAIPGLSLNPDARNPRKNLQNIFLYCRNLQQTRNIIIWHDFINNTISTHRSNYNNPATPQELIKYLTLYKHQIAAVVYVSREGTPDISEDLVKSDLLTSLVNRNLLYKRKQLHPVYSVQPPAKIELTLLTTVLFYANNLRRLTLKHRSTTSKETKEKKAKKKKRQERKTADHSVVPENQKTGKPKKSKTNKKARKRNRGES